MAEVLNDSEQGLACLVTDHHAFGLLFRGPDAEEQGWDFIDWLGSDPFQWPQAELDGEVYRWRDERLDENGRLKPPVLALRSVG